MGWVTLTENGKKKCLNTNNIVYVAPVEEKTMAALADGSGLVLDDRFEQVIASLEQADARMRTLSVEVKPRQGAIFMTTPAGSVT